MTLFPLLDSLSDAQRHFMGLFLILAQEERRHRFYFIFFFLSPTCVYDCVINVPIIRGRNVGAISDCLCEMYTD